MLIISKGKLCWILVTGLPTRFVTPHDHFLFRLLLINYRARSYTHPHLSGFTTRPTPYILLRTITSTPSRPYFLRSRDNDIFVVSAKHSSGTTNTAAVIMRNHNHVTELCHTEPLAVPYVATYVRYVLTAYHYDRSLRHGLSWAREKPATFIKKQSLQQLVPNNLPNLSAALRTLGFEVSAVRWLDKSSYSELLSLALLLAPQYYAIYIVLRGRTTRLRRLRLRGNLFCTRFVARRVMRKLGGSRRAIETLLKNVKSYLSKSFPLSRSPSYHWNLSRYFVSRFMEHFGLLRCCVRSRNNAVLTKNFRVNKLFRIEKNKN